MPRKPAKKTVMTTDLSVDALAGEAGIVTGEHFTKEEAVALRTLFAFIEGKNASVSADVVKDVWQIARAFSKEAGW